ncbi:MAG TPA: hypothetical protein VF290_14485 [Pyrinomonadaceae bacterium]
MKRILLHLAVSFLAFVLGVTASVLWRFQVSVNLPEPGLSYIPASLKIGTLGTGLDTTTYLSNGEQITRKCQNLTSDIKANSVLHARHHSGADVIEWLSIIDSHGQPIGQTILILENSSVIRLSTYREKLCETRAPTLNEMRWFENSFR